jgi:predicted DNA-binding WGR domain protein
VRRRHPRYGGGIACGEPQHLRTKLRNVLGSMILLTRIDPARNMARFYALSHAPTLFGEWLLVKEWGRIGQAGTVRAETHPDAETAAEALARQISVKRVSAIPRREANRTTPRWPDDGGYGAAVGVRLNPHGDRAAMSEPPA